MRNKIIAILLVLCLGAPIAATYTWFRYHRKQVRREVKHHLMSITDKKDLVLLSFSEEETQSKLTWKHSKEFEWKGNMYDVVETNVTADSVFYWCWPDNKETKLCRQLTEAVSIAFGNSPQKNENQQRLKRFYKSLYFVSDRSRFTDLNASTFLTKPYTNLYTSVVLPTWEPPPRHMV